MPPNCVLGSRFWRNSLDKNEDPQVTGLRVFSYAANGFSVEPKSMLELGSRFARLPANFQTALAKPQVDGLLSEGSHSSR